MILTFSRKEFIPLIKNGIKKHTIREDRGNRWKVGNIIHFWFGNPRNVKNNPFQFGTGIVSNVNVIAMYLDKDIVINFNKVLTGKELNKLAIDDGFENWEKMKEFFLKREKTFYGKIIYWDNLLIKNVKL